MCKACLQHDRRVCNMWTMIHTYGACTRHVGKVCLQHDVHVRNMHVVFHIYVTCTTQVSQSMLATWQTCLQHEGPWLTRSRYVQNMLAKTCLLHNGHVCNMWTMLNTYLTYTEHGELKHVSYMTNMFSTCEPCLQYVHHVYNMWMMIHNGYVQNMFAQTCLQHDGHTHIHISKYLVWFWRFGHTCLQTDRKTVRQALYEGQWHRINHKVILPLYSDDGSEAPFITFQPSLVNLLSPMRQRTLCILNASA
jgi:hypothetical protein